MNDLMATYNDQIVIANVIFKTTRKLVALDETGEIAYGDDDLDIFTYHKVHFDTFHNNSGDLNRKSLI